MKLSSKFKHLDILLVPLAILGCLYVTTNITLFNINMAQNLTLLEQIMAGLIAIISIGMFLLIRREEISFNPILIILLMLVFVTSLITTLSIKSPQNLNILGLHGEYWDVTFSINSLDRVSYIIRFFFVLLLGYILINVMPQVIRVKNMIFYIYLGIGILLALVMYSFIVEKESYINFVKALINHDMEQVYLNSVHSVFPNKNSFGVILFLLIIGSIYVSFLTKRKWPLIIVPFVYLELVFTSCKAALILSLVFIIIYFLFLFFYTYKDNKKRNIIVLVISSGISLIIIASLLIIPSTRNLINDGLFGVGKFSMNERLFIWGNILKILNSSNWFTGLGYGTFSAMLSTYNHADPGGGTIYTDQAHNGYLQALGEGGIIYLVVITLIIVLYIVKAIKSFKQNKGIVFLSLSLFVILAIYSLVEGITPIFTSTMEYFCLNALIFVPVLSIGLSKDETSVNKENTSIKNMPYFLISIILAGPIMFANIFFTNSISILIGAIINLIIIFVPFIQLLMKKEFNKYKYQYLYFMSVILLSALFGFLISLFNIASISLMLMCFIIPLLVICLISGSVNTPISHEFNALLSIMDSKKENCFEKLNKARIQI